MPTTPEPTESAAIVTVSRMLPLLVARSNGYSQYLIDCPNVHLQPSPSAAKVVATPVPTVSSSIDGEMCSDLSTSPDFIFCGASSLMAIRLWVLLLLFWLALLLRQVHLLNLWSLLRYVLLLKYERHCLRSFPVKLTCLPFLFCSRRFVLQVWKPYHNKHLRDSSSIECIQTYKPRECRSCRLKSMFLCCPVFPRA